MVLSKFYFKSPYFLNCCRSNAFAVCKSFSITNVTNSKALLKSYPSSYQSLKSSKIYKENIFTVPNFLTAIRIGLTPVIAYYIISQEYMTALTLFSIAGLTDLLDGYIARNVKGQASSLGSLMDPVADKLLISTMYISLTASGALPVYLCSLVIGRDVILLTSGAYLRYKSLPVPRKWSSFFDPSLATINMNPTTLSKWNTAVQLSLVAGSLTSFALKFSNEQLLEYACYVTAISTIASGCSYLLTKNTYQMLSKKNK